MRIHGRRCGVGYSRRERESESLNEAKMEIHEADKDGDNAYMNAASGSNIEIMKFLEKIDPEIVKSTNFHGIIGLIGEGTRQFLSVGTRPYSAPLL